MQPSHPFLPQTFLPPMSRQFAAIRASRKKRVLYSSFSSSQPFEFLFGAFQCQLLRFIASWVSTHRHTHSQSIQRTNAKGNWQNEEIYDQWQKHILTFDIALLPLPPFSTLYWRCSGDKNRSVFGLFCCFIAPPLFLWGAKAVPPIPTRSPAHLEKVRAPGANGATHRWLFYVLPSFFAFLIFFYIFFLFFAALYHRSFCTVFAFGFLR